MKPSPNPSDFTASVIVGRKPTTTKPPRRKSTPLPPEPPDMASRYADMLIGTITAKRDGIPETFREDSAAFIARLRSIHRDDATTAEAIARVREFAAELGIYFESVTRVKSKIRQDVENAHNHDHAEKLITQKITNAQKR